jgi:putative ABC transport system substrate-binding protein
MRRRSALAMLCGATVWPLVARAQNALPVIGFLNAGSEQPFAHLAEAFRTGLREEGFVDGRNVRIDYRWAGGFYDRLPALAAELVERKVTLLVTTGGEPATLAAKAPTSTIPVVFAVGGDPVRAGLVKSLSRPGGNMTGLSQFTTQLESKRVSLLHELVPTATRIGLVFNPDFPAAQFQFAEVERAVAQAGLAFVHQSARSEAEFEPAFAELQRQRIHALIVGPDPFFNTRRHILVELAARHKFPTIYDFREFTLAGGLMSYGANLADGYRKVGAYAGRVLKGANPADLPVLQPTTFELVINLRTAAALGFDVPRALLVRADEVLE